MSIKINVAPTPVVHTTLVSSPKRAFLAKTLPLLLLAMLILSAVTAVFSQAATYGITNDEALQDQYGRYALKWYESLGRDRSIFHFPKNMHMLQHGVIFEVVVAAGENMTGNQWGTRAIMCGLAGVAGVIAIALCGLELSGWWLAFVAALCLWLFPRFYGSIYNNSKDMPFLSASLFVLWALILLQKQWAEPEKFLRNTILLGFLIGLAASIRVTAIMWYGVLICIQALWWIQNGRQTMRDHKLLSALAKHMGALLMVSSVSLLTMMALWPYILLNPLPHLYDAIVVLARYPWPGTVTFAGHTYQASALPYTYVPGWLVLGSPPAIVFCAGLAIIAVCVLVLKKKDLTLPAVTALLALLLPLTALTVTHPTLYDGPRQFLFLYGPLVLLAAYGFIQLLTWLAKYRVLVILFIAIACLTEGQVVLAMQAIHPYEYVYFSPLVGGIPGATGKYDMDYYLSCNKAAADWLSTHYAQYTHKEHPTVQVEANIYTALPFLPKTFILDQAHPDFFISSTRDHQDQDPQFADYRIIDKESIQGYIACVVKVDPHLMRR
ncbi:MAG: glycosyltransferase family 39 protein [Ktedonobacteraceae bacterium]|nr:glycosyltransferase family 39 protein [Ktedonobacteraceae bacterium]